MTRIVVALVLSLGVLVGWAAPSSARADEELTTRQARALYQDVTCDVGAARTRYNNRVFGPDNWITIAEVRRRLSELRDLAWTMSLAEARAARRLYHAPAAWPAEVVDEIDTVVDYRIRASNVLNQMSGANSAVRFIELGKKANKMGPGRAPDRIRVYLSVPVYPRG
ncbi:hypothetical protein [Nocardioides astragali]|nr:hypothetical protein [Nocardioides astragali]